MQGRSRSPTRFAESAASVLGLETHRQPQYFASADASEGAIATFGNSAWLNVEAEWRMTPNTEL
ncbi:MAG: hypothetical protein AAFX40_06720 [Cyanobacteria bacterium J06639_1]